MSKNQNFNYLEWVKREKEEDEKRTDGNRSEKVVGVILLLGTFLFAVYLIFNLISEVGKVQKGTDNEPIEVPIEHEPTQMEMNGWREPSALDIIIHSDSGSQEPDTVGLSFFSSFLYYYKLDTIFFLPPRSNF
jgi:hypothetical protein